jgi:hypothetical protein
VLLTSVFAGNSSKIARARMHALSVCKVRSHLAFYGSESEPYRGVKAVPPTTGDPVSATGGWVRAPHPLNIIAVDAADKCAGIRTSAQTDTLCGTMLPGAELGER